MFSFFKSGISKIKSALTKTRDVLGKKIQSLFGQPIDEHTFERLEQILYEADLGTELAVELVEKTERFLRKKRDAHADDIVGFLREEARALLSEPPQTHPKQGSPHLLLIVGVNGSGKTTTIAKLAGKYKKEGKKVLLAAGDTFRAAAIDQLAHWAEQVGVDIVKGAAGGDPAAVIYDALSKACAKNYDIVIADTAGRLQSKQYLMEELGKVLRVSQKIIPDSPHETLLILDATTGQNALDQAQTFNEFTPLSGLIITKLDGSAKGGMLLSIYKKLKIPIKYIGVGEKESDLIPFDKEEYVASLF